MGKYPLKFQFPSCYHLSHGACWKCLHKAYEEFIEKAEESDARLRAERDAAVKSAQACSQKLDEAETENTKLKADLEKSRRDNARLRDSCWEHRCSDGIGGCNAISAEVLSETDSSSWLQGKIEEVSGPLREAVLIAYREMRWWSCKPDGKMTEASLDEAREEAIKSMKELDRLISSSPEPVPAQAEDVHKDICERCGIENKPGHCDEMGEVCPGKLPASIGDIHKDCVAKRCYACGCDTIDEHAQCFSCWKATENAANTLKTAHKDCEARWDKAVSEYETVGAQLVREREAHAEERNIREEADDACAGFEEALKTEKNQVLTLAARVTELETKFRQDLWLGHGHHGLYGDDGEMQCGKCLADFKREPFLDLVHKIARRAEKELSAARSELAVRTENYNYQRQRAGNLVQRVDRLEAELDKTHKEAVRLREALESVYQSMTATEYCMDMIKKDLVKIEGPAWDVIFESWELDRNELQEALSSTQNIEDWDRDRFEAKDKELAEKGNRINELEADLEYPAGSDAMFHQIKRLEAALTSQASRHAAEVEKIEAKKNYCPSCACTSCHKKHEEGWSNVS